MLNLICRSRLHALLVGSLADVGIALSLMVRNLRIPLDGTVVDPSGLDYTVPEMILRKSMVNYAEKFR